VSAGGYSSERVQSRLRAAVNARLEEISFRTGLITATIGLIALTVIAAAGVYAATLSLGSQAAAAAGALGSPRTTPVATASARPTAPGHPQAPSTPKARQPVTAATVSPQSAAGGQAWAQAEGSQSGARYYGRAGFGGHGSPYGGHGSSYGGHGPRYGGHGFPGRGFGSLGHPGLRGFGRP
jgi:hypothetical protein